MAADRKLTVAVTGATGFAGGPAVAELLKQGHHVAALVRNPAKALLPADVRAVTGDLADQGALGEVMAGADAVVHLAGAIAGLTRADYLRHNAAPLPGLAQAAIKAGVKRFVHVSSLAAREPQLSPYGASKRAGEDAIGAYAQQLGLLIVRPPAIYGPGDRGTLPLLKELIRPIAMIPGRREQRFSLIHVEDVARILADAVTSDATGLRELSDGRTAGYDWDDLIRIAERAEGHRVRPIFLPKALVGCIAAVALGISRLRGKPGMINPGKVAELYHADWVARGEGWPLADPTTFDKGLPATLAWYRAAGWLPPARAASTRHPASS